MAPAYIMAIITTGIAAAAWLGLVHAMAGRHRRLAWLAAATLPLSFAVNDWVKRPLLVGVARWAGVERPAEAPFWFAVLVLFTAPVTEEAVKALPLLSGRLRAALNETGAALWAGMALGAGFGLSEIWWIARGIARSPALASYPLWAYTGFLGERVAVTFAHAVMTAVTATGLVQGQAARGYLAAVGLHALLNLEALLGRMGLLDDTLASLWIAVPLAVLTTVFSRLCRAARAGEEPPEAVIFRRDPS